MNYQFKSAWYLPGAHLQTIVPALFRKPKNHFTRKTIITPDNDFLDIDLLLNNNDKLCIITHGLEGSTCAQYVLGLTKSLANNGFDVLAWNNRGCSGRLNKAVRYYHSGLTEDLHLLIKYATDELNYQQIYLVGFSVGGNITLKYCGEQGLQLNHAIKKIATVSVPVHLASSARELDKAKNKIYLNRFLKSLKPKVISKINQIPFNLNPSDVIKWKTFLEFDGNYTAPMYGFSSAQDYWDKSSSIHFLKFIQVQTLMISSLNDPFLAKECFPSDSEIGNQNIKTIYTNSGGHVGFCESFFSGNYFSEKSVLAFFTND